MLKEIEKFYYSDFWISRFKKRTGKSFNVIELDCILGTISDTIDNVKIEYFKGSSKGKSQGHTIYLNTNLTNFEDTLIHELGHILYNLEGFKKIVDLNKEIIGNPAIHLKSNLTKKDYAYFINDNELRLRIIPLVIRKRELIEDDIKDIFNKEYITYLINNIL